MVIYTIYLTGSFSGFAAFAAFPVVPGAPVCSSREAFKRGVAEFFGAEASNFTKKNLLGETVFIALDRDTRDKYGRLLAYIYLKDGDCFNAKLIREGMAHCYTRFPYQFMEEFRLYEKTARERKKGLWNPRP